MDTSQPPDPRTLTLAPLGICDAEVWIDIENYDKLVRQAAVVFRTNEGERKKAIVDRLPDPRFLRKLHLEESDIDVWIEPAEYEKLALQGQNVIKLHAKDLHSKVLFDLIIRIYEHHAAGCCWHVVLDDQNWDSIDFCRQFAKEHQGDCITEGACLELANTDFSDQELQQAWTLSEGLEIHETQSTQTRSEGEADQDSSRINGITGNESKSAS